MLFFVIFTCQCGHHGFRVFSFWEDSSDDSIIGLQTPSERVATINASSECHWLALHHIDGSDRRFGELWDLMSACYFLDCGAGMYQLIEAVGVHTLNPTDSRIDSVAFFPSICMTTLC